MNRSVGAAVQRLVGLAQRMRSGVLGGLRFLRFPRPRPTALAQCLRHHSEHGVVATDAWSNLLIVFLCVTHLVKLRLPK